MGSAQHGTRARYITLKCRCDECRSANRDYFRSLRKNPDWRRAERDRERERMREVRTRLYASPSAHAAVLQQAREKYTPVGESRREQKAAYDLRRRSSRPPRSEWVGLSEAEKSRRTAANSERRRAQESAAKAQATRLWVRWSNADDLVLADASMTDLEKAILLGRTLSSIAQRRARLRKIEAQEGATR